MLFELTGDGAEKICHAIKQNGDDYQDELRNTMALVEMAKLCESPIESILFWKLVSRLKLTFFAIEKDWKPGDVLTGIASFLNEDCSPNVADELKGLVFMTSLFLQSPTPANGRLYRPDFKLYATRFHSNTSADFIIEADGHEFHEKTKEQAIRDKMKDRDLTKEGFYILRFSGSEIWNDCDKVVDEIIAQIVAKVKR